MDIRFLSRVFDSPVGDINPPLNVLIYDRATSSSVEGRKIKEIRGREAQGLYIIF